MASKTAATKKAATQKRDLDRSKLPVTTECLLTKKDVCNALSIGERMLSVMRTEGKFPAPDLHLGKLPRWRVGTFNAWLDAYHGHGTGGD